MIEINPYEIILQIINFGILYYLLKKFLSEPLSNMLSKRASMIKHNIESAELNKRKADELVTEKGEALKSAQLEAQSIRKKAEVAAEKELQQIIDNGKKSADQLLDQAKKDIEIQTNTARKELLENVGDITVKVVEKYVTTNVSEDDKKQTIDQLIEQVSNK